MAISLQADSTLPQGYILVDGQRVASVSTTGGLSATLAANTVTTSALVSGSVTTEKIAPGAVVTADLADGAVTAAKMAGGQTGDAPVYGCRAWVNFKGNVNANINNCNYTFNQGATVVTITTPIGQPHGLVPGNMVNVENPSPGVPPQDVAWLEGSYRVATVPNPNTLTYNTTVPAEFNRAGTIRIRGRQILASGNVNRVSPGGQGGDSGNYFINFQTPMLDSNYIHLAPTVGQASSSYNWGVRAVSATESFLQVQINNSNTGANITDPPYVAVAIIR